MLEPFRPILELLILIPGMLLAYLPVRNNLKQEPLKLLLWLLPFLMLLAITGGFVAYLFRISTGWILLGLTLICMCLYIKTLRISIWKSTSIFLSIVAVFTCLNSLARAIDAILTLDASPIQNEVWFCFETGLIYNLFCWCCVFLVWYPATHAARELIQNENIPITWKLFWILPSVFIGLNLFMIPQYRETLYTHRVLQGYVVITLALLILLALLYALFLITATHLNKNTKLEQELQFLALQQTHFDNLKTAIEETRYARHDLRHHFSRLSAMAEKGDLDQMKSYLDTAQKSIPNLELCFSENQAVDSVIGHYYLLARRDQIPFTARVDLPVQLPVDEMDLYLVLSNLLENALEASVRTTSKHRQIKLTASMHSEHLVLILVQNTYDGDLKVKDGLFRSTKHKGNGIGIQSIRHIAEKNGGDTDFTYDGKTFTAKVMLRGKTL